MSSCRCATGASRRRPPSRELRPLRRGFHRSARSRACPVDYTRVRHVKKPQGARPGMVNYFQYQTVLVAPAQL